MDNDIVLTPKIAVIVMDKAREICEGKKRPLEPTAVEIFGLNDGSPVFKVTGIRTVVRKAEAKTIGGLFGLETEEKTAVDHFEDFCYVWGHELPAGVVHELLNASVERTDGPRRFGKHVREVEHV